MGMMGLSRRYIDLVRELTWNDFKLKYNRSVLGFFWSLLKPLLMLGTLYMVFSVFMKIDVPFYPLFLLLGIILWNFFSDATLTSMFGLLGKADLIKKVYFPREIIVLSSVLNATISLLLNLVVFGFFFLLLGAPLHLAIVGVLPPLFIIFLLALGFSYGLAALFVRFRDLAHIWEVILAVGFWITPIIYPISIVPQRYLGLFLLNPMASIIGAARDATIFGNFPSASSIGLTLLMSLVVFTVGLLVFRKISWSFAEEL